MIKGLWRKLSSPVVVMWIVFVGCGLATALMKIEEANYGQAQASEAGNAHGWGHYTTDGYGGIFGYYGYDGFHGYYGYHEATGFDPHRGYYGYIQYYGYQGNFNGHYPLKGYESHDDHDDHGHDGLRERKH